MNTSKNDITIKNEHSAELIIKSLTDVLSHINVKIKGFDLKLSTDTKFEYGICEKFCELKIKLEDSHSISTNNHGDCTLQALTGAVSKLKMNLGV